MRELLKKYLIEALKQYANQILTEGDNIKRILNYVVGKLQSAAQSTDNSLDDWIVCYLQSLLTEKNIRTLYEFISDSIGSVTLDTDGAPVFGAAMEPSEDAYAELAEKLAADGKTFASPSLIQIVGLLRLVLPIIIDWFAKPEGKK